ncbi:MAG: hypothetical protein KF819_38790 [Labilithrix sp.]|nr:hypothetical protein [Labilithrix sp.]
MERRIGVALALAIAACAATKQEPHAPLAERGDALAPDGPPPALPSNEEIAATTPPARKTTAASIPDEPPDVPVPSRRGPRPPAHAKVDALLAAIEGADTIEIKDEWEGRSGSFDTFVRLERKGDELAYRAKVGERAGSVGERVADPTEPPDAHRVKCLCPIDGSCPCEAKYERKSGTTSLETTRAFLRRLSRKRVDATQKHRAGSIRTDDHPYVHVVFMGKALEQPLHLSVRDNQRHWRANGLFLAPDPPPAPYEVEATVLPQTGPARAEKQTIVPTDKHALLTQSYTRMLGLLGTRDWR